MRASTPTTGGAASNGLADELLARIESDDNSEARSRRSQHGRRRGTRRTGARPWPHRARSTARGADRLLRPGARVARRLPPPCVSSPRSTCGTTRKTSHGSSSARCHRCTSCCRMRASRPARTCSMSGLARRRAAAGSTQLLADAAGARDAGRRRPRCLHIMGVRQETATRANVEGRRFRLHDRRNGDGTVPLVLASVPEAENWFAAETHGGLPNNGKVISAVVDLLREGTTGRLRPRRVAPPRSRRARRRIHAAAGRAPQGALAGPFARRAAQAARARRVARVPRRRFAGPC